MFLQIPPPFLSNSLQSSDPRSRSVAVCGPLLADYKLSSPKNFCQVMAENVCCRVPAGNLWLSSWLTTQTCLGGFLFAPASLHWWIFSCLSQETSPPPNPEAVNFLRAYSRCGSGIKPCRPLSPRPVRAKAGADTEAPEAQGAETKVSYTLTASIPGISGTHPLLLL